MRRVESDGMWSLMCPNECPGLQDCWGEAFDKLYERYLTMAIHIYAQLAAYSDPMPDGGVASDFISLIWMKGFFQSICMCCPFPKHKNVDFGDKFCALKSLRKVLD